MQKSKNERLKYAIATAAAVAVFAVTPFIGKKCMREDIQKSEPERPKKTLVTENNEKAAAKELANLITVTPIEEENTGKEPQNIDENVKKIIEEYPYEKMECPGMPISDDMEKEYYKGDFEFWMGISNETRKLWKQSREIFLMISEICGEEITIDSLDALERCQADIPGMTEVGKLSEEGKTEQLLTVLRHMESLGIEWESDTYRSYGPSSTLNFEYAFQNAVAEHLDGMGYDRKCIAYITKALFVTNATIGGLAYSTINGSKNISEVYENVPELYRTQFVKKLAMQVLDDVSAERLEWTISTLPEEQVDQFYEWIAGYCINKEFRNEMNSVLKNVDDKEIRTKLEDAIREGGNREEESEDEIYLMRMEIESHRILESEESDFEDEE